MWKITSGRKGWDTRWLRQVNATSLKLPQRRPSTMGDLGSQERCLHLLRDSVRRKLNLIIPPGYTPVDAVYSAPSQLTEGIVPECLLVFGRSLGAAIALADTERASVCGAFFEKAFREIERIIRSSYHESDLILVHNVAATYPLSRPDVRQILLKQLYQMSLKIHGPHYHLTLWTKCLLDTPDNAGYALAQVFCQTLSNTICDALGKYSSYALKARIRNLDAKDKSTDAERHILEYEELIRDCRASPEYTNRRAWTAELNLADHLITSVNPRDYLTASRLTLPFVERIRERNAENSDRSEAWSL